MNRTIEATATSRELTADPGLPAKIGVGVLVLFALFFNYRDEAKTA